MELRADSTFAGYRVVSQIGRGGMGVVYRAIDESLERPVALKLMASEVAEDLRFRERFLRESRTAAALDHPNVVPIYEAGEERDHLFIAMRYVEGEDLRALLAREGRLEPERALAVLAQVADALDAAHAKGLVHRDVKPGNVLLDRRSHVYLTDFGLSRQVGSTSTQTGRIVGTFDYLSPEQIRGEEVDARSDEYGLACLLYECLSGSAPFHRESEAATLWAHMQEESPSLRDLPQLDAVLARGLAKDRADRYATCSALVAAAGKALELEAPSGTRPSAPAPRGTVTFLFTDIEGSTQLLKQLGSEYAPALADHQRLVRAACSAHGGREVDTQGDSFFFAFPRAKDAVGAASRAQRDLAAHPWPEGSVLRVRMGLHTGEPFVGDERYVGIGVHKAARIAAAGHGGQVLLSSTTRDLVEDELPPRVGLRDLGEHRLKDLDRPERIYQLVIEDIPSHFGPLKTLDLETRRKRRFLVLAGIAVVLGAAALGTLFVLRSGGGGATVPPNSVGLIDAATNDVVGDVSVGIRPGAVAAGNGSVWVANQDDKSLSRIDTSSRQVVRTIGLDATPTGVVEGESAVWVAEGSVGTVVRIDPGLNEVTKSIGGLTGPVRVSGAPTGTVTTGSGDVWAAFGSSAVVRIDPKTNRPTASGFAGFSAAAIAYGEGAVWVANQASNTVSEISPITSRKVADINVGRGPSGIAVGGGALWVSDTQDDAVSRIDVRTHASKTISVGSAPIGIAYSDGAVWVANSGDGTISRIDPERNEVVDTIRIGSSPIGVALDGGLVWVSVSAS